MEGSFRVSCQECARFLSELRSDEQIKSLFIEEEDFTRFLLNTIEVKNSERAYKNIEDLHSDIIAACNDKISSSPDSADKIYIVIRKVKLLYEEFSSFYSLLNQVIQEIQQIFLDLKIFRKKYPASSETSLYDSFREKFRTVMMQNLTFIEKSFSFYDSNTDIMNINYLQGFILAVVSLLLFLTNYQNFSDFLGLIVGYTREHFLEILRDHIVESDTIENSFIVTGLSIQTYKKDWYFFFEHFNSDGCYISLDYLENSNDIEPFHDIVIGIISSPIFIDILSLTFTNGDQERLINYGKEALRNTYARRFYDSSTGLLTYTKKIFIQCYQGYSKRIAKAASAILFLHEFSHYLRRISCNTIREVKNNYTPPTFYPVFTPEELEEIRLKLSQSTSSFVVDASEETVNKVEAEVEKKEKINPEKLSSNCQKLGYLEMISQLESCQEYNISNNRGEAGFSIEQVLFKCEDRVNTLNLEAAGYLIDYRNYPNSLEEFQENFNKLNNAYSREHVTLNRGGRKFGIVHCRMRHMW